MQLHELTSLKAKNKGTRRVGRGPGSGRGTTSGRGTKGQKARTGGAIPSYFEGGQKPLTQIIPKKKGFRRPNKPKVFIINLSGLPRLADDHTLNLEILRSKGYLNGFDFIKVLGEGELTEAFNIEVHQASAAAQAKIIRAGGKVNLIK